MGSIENRVPRHVRRVLEMAEHDPQLQALMPDQTVLTALSRDGQLYEQTIDIALTGYADRPALAEREVDIAIDPSTGRAVRHLLPSWSSVTYGELHRRVRALAEVWRRHGVHRVAEGDFVCVLGFSGIDFVTLELALAYARGVHVPLQTTLAGFDLDGIVERTRPVAVAATVSDLEIAARLAGGQPAVRSIIAFEVDERFDDDRDQLAAARAELERSGSTAQVILLSDLIAEGRPDDWSFYPVRSDTAERMAMVIHSSGSTGTPKGAVFLDTTIGVQMSMVPKHALPLVRLCFAPLNHQLGRGQVCTTISRGGTAYFTARADMSTLFEDFRLVRPTEIAVFPRVLEMIHRHYLTEVARRVAEGVEPDEASLAVMQGMRAGYLGDRLVAMVASGAPTTPEVLDFIKTCFEVTLVENYGSTELNGAVTFQNRIQRPPVIDYRLRDVPELGYFATDKPYPRGELVVKTTHSVPGYYKQPDATAALFDDEGYLRTGDVMEERAPDHLVFIDRRNDVLKLAQGEFVTCGSLGTTFESGSDVIGQAFVYGSSARSYLLAVIVPDPVVVTARLGAEASPDAVRALIRAELKRVGREEGLRSFEIPRDFIVERVPFSHENGLLSSVHKKMRPNLQRRYGEALERLYQSLEARHSEELMALSDPASQLSVLEKIGVALAAVLGVDDVDVTRPIGFGEMGGDSLGAAELSALLSDVLGVDVPLSTIWSPTGTPVRWAAFVEHALAVRDGSAVQPTFANVHGKGARALRADDLDLARFLDPDALAGAATGEPPTESRHVLVTGATGFLGRFVCLDWLERMSAVGGRVTCLVRAGSDADARDRLLAAYAGDPDLEARVAELAADHLDVVVGDIALPRLDLDRDSYRRLALEVDRIVHAAALVNHVLDYEHLFGPNVAATADLIGLALSERQKRFDFVSSLAVAPFVDRSSGYSEVAPLNEVAVLNDAYTAGYGASKWAGEVLLHQAHDRFGLPVNILRGDMMLPHSRYRGQINVPDVFIRMLFSLVTTGIAPESFYERAPDGGRARAHYDGLPVDFVAGSVTGIGALAHGGLRTFNMVNPHLDDGVSLDSFVDWIESAGYPIERIVPYAAWFAGFEQRLRSMPERQRQHSSLLVLEPFRRLLRATPSMVGCNAFVEAVAEIPCGPEVPHISEIFIHKCLDDLRAHQLIGEPSQVDSDRGPMRVAAVAG